VKLCLIFIAAEQVIRINESICDGTYQAPDPAQSLNTIPMYSTTLNELGRCDSSPSPSVCSTSTPTSSFAPSVHSSYCAACVQSVTDDDDEFSHHTKPKVSTTGNPLQEADPNNQTDAYIGPSLSSVPQRRANQLPLILRPYVPGRQCE
jgi:hypothetical protein